MCGRLGETSESITKVSQWLEPCLKYMASDGLGQLCELCDGDAPHTGRGAMASALSVAEILRCYSQEVLGIAAARPKMRPISHGFGGKPVVSSTPK